MRVPVTLRLQEEYAEVLRQRSRSEDIPIGHLVEHGLNTFLKGCFSRPPGYCEKVGRKKGGTNRRQPE